MGHIAKDRKRQSIQTGSYLFIGVGEPKPAKQKNTPTSSPSNQYEPRPVRRSARLTGRTALHLVYPKG